MRGPLFVLIALAAGCGRLGFDPGDRPRDGGSDGDAPAADAAPLAPRTVLVGGAGAQEVAEVAYGPDGALALVGSFGTDLALGALTATTTASVGDMFVAILEPDGTPRWLTSLGASGIGSGQNVAWEAGAVHAAGYFGGSTTLGALSSGAGQDVVLLRFDPQAPTPVAERYGGGSNVQLRGLAVRGATVAVGGVYGGSPDFGAGALPAAAADNGFLVVAPGASAAHRAFTGASDVFVNDLAFDAAGALCVTGRYNTTTDFGGGPVGPVGGSSGFVIRFDPGLVYRWSRVWGGGINGTHVAATADGGCTAAGAFTGQLAVDGFVASSAGGDDGYVVRLDAAGAVRWLQTFASPGNDLPLAVEPLAGDRLAVAGKLAGPGTLLGAPATVDGASDGFVAVLDPTGALAGETRLGGAGEVTNTIGGGAVSPDGAALALGVWFTGDLTVGGTTHTAAAGDVDSAVVIVPLAP